MLQPVCFLNVFPLLSLCLMVFGQLTSSTPILYPAQGEVSVEILHWMLFGVHGRDGGRSETFPSYRGMHRGSSMQFLEIRHLPAAHSPRSQEIAVCSPQNLKKHARARQDPASLHPVQATQPCKNLRDTARSWKNTPRPTLIFPPPYGPQMVPLQEQMNFIAAQHRVFQNEMSMSFPD